VVPAAPIDPSAVVALEEAAMDDVVASRVSVRELKTHLSAWLARAQAGEVVEVTSHHKPIARITAVKPQDPASMSPLQQAIEADVISWSGQKPVFHPPIKLNDGGPLISDSVIEDRG
jgi:prevent-host-death family protein